MSECEEVAAAMPLMPPSYTFDDTLRQVRMMMPGESEVVLDNVAYALWRRSTGAQP
jgi:hypothetical protein